MKWIRENILINPSFNQYNTHIDTIENTVMSNPALCIETCKSLIEGLCKTILNNKGESCKSDVSFNGLVHQTLSVLINNEENYKSDMTELSRRISSVAQKIGEIRNNAGFASHGVDIKEKKVDFTLSQFMFKITDSIGGFILNYYCNRKEFDKDIRIHYEDCWDFNDSFDEDNPIQFGFINISASEALYMQDYDAYKESYFEYIENLKLEYGSIN